MSNTDERVLTAGRLNNDDFWLVLENHLNETEWRFTNRVGDRGVPGIRPNTEQHPIRVLGRNFVAAEAGQHRDPGLALRQHLLDSGYGSVLAE